MTTPDFDFGPDAPWTVRLESPTFFWTALENGKPVLSTIRREDAEMRAWAGNLLHFGPSLLAELEDLRAEYARLKDRNP